MELNIKHEPAVDYELILPPTTEVEVENNDPFGIKPCSAIYLAYCRHCKMILRSERSLKGHEQICRMICEFCDTKFVNLDRFMSHTNAKPIECQLCQSEFKCRTLWSKHLQEHHQEGFNCDRCSFVDKSKSRFDKHYYQHTKKFSCETCDGGFSSNYRLKNHQMQHKHGVFKNIETSFNCNQCEKAYQTQHGLNQHKIHRHQDKSLECDFCGRKCVTKQKMTNHLQSHVEVECKFCGKVLAESRMAHHMNKEHIKSERSFSCKDCGKRFLEKRNYNCHINPKKPAIECPSCQIIFKCQNHWQKHQKEEHAEGFKCNQCSYVGKARNQLRKHLMIHTKKFSCDSCHMKFATKFDLDDHEKNH